MQTENIRTAKLQNVTYQHTNKLTTKCVQYLNQHTFCEFLPAETDLRNPKNLLFSQKCLNKKCSFAGHEWMIYFISGVFHLQGLYYNVKRSHAELSDVDKVSSWMTRQMLV